MSGFSQRKFVWRSFTSVLLGLVFLALILSGSVLFMAPPGRVANWTGWSIWGLTKHDWGAVHMVFSAVFLLAAGLHLVFNWRPMVNYFRDRVTRRLGFRWEWPLAILCTVAVFAGVRARWAPFSSLVDASEAIRARWEDPGERAPIPHAELLSLSELARQAAVEFATASNRLAARGCTNLNEDIIVADLAHQHQLTAQEIYAWMTETARGRGWGGGRTKGAGPGSESRETHQPAGGGKGGRQAGGGLGWKTLEEFCAQENLDLDATLLRLKERGLHATATQTMREIAVNHGYQRPFELVEFLRGNTNALTK